jgi:hypothetical protein
MVINHMPIERIVMPDLLDTLILEIVFEEHEEALTGAIVVNPETRAITEINIRTTINRKADDRSVATW